MENKVNGIEEMTKKLKELNKNAEFKYSSYGIIFGGEHIERLKIPEGYHHNGKNYIMDEEGKEKYLYVFEPNIGMMSMLTYYKK